MAGYLTLVFTSCVLFGVNELLVDDFRYSSSEAARSVWRSLGGTPLVEMFSEGDQPVLAFQAPFASNPRLERTILDCDKQLDLSAAGRVVLEIRTLQTQSPAQLTLYFRSGAGWFAGSAQVSPQGWRQVVLTRDQFRSEGSPAGWHAIDGIRLSIWRDKPEDFVVQVRRLVACWSDVTLLVPRADGSVEAREMGQFASTFARILDELGVSHDLGDEEAVRMWALKHRRVLIIPYHPRLDDRTSEAIAEFVDAGGKLFACYVLPSNLRTRLGIRELRYWRPQEGTLAEIRFAPGTVVGLPAVMRQASWNINEPLLAEGAKPLAHWYDRAGNPTGRIAASLADTGVFLSHVLLDDDLPRKRWFVAAVLGHLHPPLWPTMARNAIGRAQTVGHCSAPTELEAFLREAQVLATPEYEQYRKLLDRANELAETGDFPQAMQTAEAARGQLLTVYAKAMPSPTREGRAFWNHSGTGAYPGDWERTARELAQAGFNMVLPNMLWGGLAHYPSDLLPRSATYRKLGDQIAQCLAACRRHGIEVHVWKVNWNLSTAPREFVDKMRAEGRLQKSFRGEEHAWLCPSHPENFRLEIATMLEVVQKYDVDGIHFDYIRYPGGEYCYCEGCRERFESSLGRSIADWPAEVRSGELRQAYLEFRVAQINRLVEAVSREARQLRPNIKISAAVFGAYPDCRVSVGQDWVHWVRSGYLDFVCPMDYTEDDAYFQQLVTNQIRLVGGKIPLYPGIGAWRLPPDRVLGQIFLARKLGANGFTVFDLNEDAAQNLLPVIRLGVGAKRATPLHRGE